ncbi:tetratricopeptide repeat protein [Azospirillum sp.]|uniref:tetratricopeptide repeat protein n=1 Tax=Azospirillum sp. TaxID=34012 RepID=UPI003D73832F
MRLLVALSVAGLLAAGAAHATHQAGHGTPAKTLPELTRAAEQNDAVAQNNLAVMYATGSGVKQDYGQAAKWYEKAAEQGYAIAQYNLAAMYEHGMGVSRDLRAASIWYQLAADQADPWAQFNLGRLESGGELKNIVSAYRWLYLASEAEDAEVRRVAAPQLKEVAAQLTPAQSAEATRLVTAWKSRAKK